MSKFSLHFRSLVVVMVVLTNVNTFSVSAFTSNQIQCLPRRWRITPIVSMPARNNIFASLVCSAVLPEPSVFLKEMMSSRTAQSTKVNLLSTIQTVRKSDEPTAIKFMDQLVIEIDKVALNPIAMIKWPIPLPSYRLKLGCFKRMVDELIQDEPTDMRRKRSAVAQLLRQLQEQSSIRELEKEYDRKKKSDCTMEEMLARTPPDLETPKYDVVVRRDRWEVRKYKDFSVCSFRMEGQTGGSAFNALAGYIFGKNQVCLHRIGAIVMGLGHN